MPLAILEVSKAKSILDQEGEIHESAKPKYAELLKAYEKLNKELRRLIRLSDRSQDKLNSVNSKLETFSTKLSKYFSHSNIFQFYMTDFI